MTATQKLATVAAGIPAAIRAASFVADIVQQGLEIRRQLKASRAYVVRLDSEDDIYQAAHTWLLDQIPRQQWRSIEAISDPRNALENEYGEPIGAGGRPRVAYRYDGRRVLSVDLGGHPVLVGVEREQAPPDAKVTSLKESIFFEAQSAAGRDRVMDKLEELARLSAESEPTSRILIANRYGGWQRTSSIATRDPSTVVLARGQMERLSADIGQFLASEHLYRQIGTPWHRGYLFHGPPGTGKTSAARALAFAHGLDVYYLPLSDVKSDSELIGLIAAVRDRSVLLIEDIDIAHAATDRGDDRGLSMQGLLNALDGALTPNGLITIATSNDLAALDPALVRRGRFDVSDEMGYLDDEQMERLVEVMTGRRVALPPLDGRMISAADVAEVIKAHITDMDRARAEVAAFLARPTDMAT